MTAGSDDVEKGNRGYRVIKYFMVTRVELKGINIICRHSEFVSESFYIKVWQLLDPEINSG